MMIKSLDTFLILHLLIFLVHNHLILRLMGKKRLIGKR